MSIFFRLVLFLHFLFIYFFVLLYFCSFTIYIVTIILFFFDISFFLFEKHFFFGLCFRPTSVFSYIKCMHMHSIYINRYICVLILKFWIWKKKLLFVFNVYVPHAMPRYFTSDFQKWNPLFTITRQSDYHKEKKNISSQFLRSFLLLWSERGKREKKTIELDRNPCCDFPGVNSEWLFSNCHLIFFQISVVK